jgi:hypothetical protein
MRKILLIAIFNLLVCTAYAQEANDSDVQFSAFGTLAVSQSDSKDYGFRNDFSQNDIAYKSDFSFEPLTNLGVQIDAIINSEWDYVGQWVYREQDKQDLDALTTLSFIRYSPSPNWKFRAGRSAIDLFHLSEYRDVGIAYTWAKVPTEVYGFIPSRHIDGVDGIYTKDIAGINYSAKLYSGQFKSDFTSTSYDPVYFKDVLGARLTMETFDWSINLRHSQASVNRDNDSLTFVSNTVISAQALWPNASNFADDLSFVGKTLTYSSLSGQYNWHPLLFMAEFAKIDSNSSVISNIDNGYLSTIYQTDKHSIHFTYSFTETTPYRFDEFVLARDPLLPLISLVEQQLNAFRTNQITRSIGWRYDINNQFALKIQWDHTTYKGLNSSMIGSDIILPEREDGDLDTLHLTLSFSL